jgi:hypothetical protein
MASSLFRNERFLLGGFLLLAAVAALVTGSLAGGNPTELLYGLLGGLAAGTIVVGSYVIGVRRGQPHSHAVATAAIVFGGLFILTLVARLLTEFGV